MPIVFVHGVAVRSQDSFAFIREMLWQYVAPRMVMDPSQARNVRIYTPFWGDIGAQFAWNRSCVPGSANATMGLDTVTSAQILDTLANEQDLLRPRRESIGPSDVAVMGSSAKASMGQSTAASSKPVEASANDLSELLVGIAAAPRFDGDTARLTRSAAWAASALDRATLELVPTDQPISITPELLDRIKDRASTIYRELERNSGDVAQGFDPIAAAINGAKRIVSAVEDGAGDLLTTVILKYRPQINTGLTNFFGDVFVYEATRGTSAAPGPIITRIIDGLIDAVKGEKTHAGEPIIVLSHSMGGQIVYDAITYYMAAIPELRGVTIHLWCAAASQVGLFEEMKLFKGSDSKYCAANNNKAPFPQVRLNRWYNVWDPDDILSYTARPIFEDPGGGRFEDEPFKSNLSIFKAHGGYLVSPEFYRALADRV